MFIYRIIKCSHAFCLNIAYAIKFVNLCKIGLAGMADFKTDPSGHEPESFVLEWNSESSSDITEFELNWRSENGNWEGFTVPAYKQDSFHWSGKYAFINLKPATRYEAWVIAKNSEGWSRPCPTFHFATFGAGKYTYKVRHSKVWKVILLKLIGKNGYFEIS